MCISTRPDVVDQPHPCLCVRDLVVTACTAPPADGVVLTYDVRYQVSFEHDRESRLSASASLRTTASCARSTWPPRARVRNRRFADCFHPAGNTGKDPLFTLFSGEQIGSGLAICSLEGRTFCFVHSLPRAGSFRCRIDVRLLLLPINRRDR